MATRHPAFAGFCSSIQQFSLVVAAQALQMRGNLLWAQLAHQLAVLIQQARLGAEQQQLVGTQLDGSTGGYVFAGQVEDFPVGE